MFEVLESTMIVPNIHELVFEAPAVAREAQPGQFIIVRAEEDGERIPLSLSDWDEERGTVTTMVMNVGKTTSRLSRLEAGQSVPTVVGPLGNPSDIKEFGTVLCVCGCYGIGSIYPVARALKANNNKVITIIEGRSSYLLYWQEKLRGVSDAVFHITRDGTLGHKGHVGQLPEIIGSIGETVDRVFINGCTLLLKRGSEETRTMGIKTIVNLNPIMIDGTGMCGVCRVTVGSKTKFACVDGPDFDGHEVNWEELLQRRRSYVIEEARPLRTSRCEKRTCRQKKTAV